MEITERQFRAIIRKAFLLGEGWAITYQTWFEPSKKYHREKRQEAIEKCRRQLAKQQEKERRHGETKH